MQRLLFVVLAALALSTVSVPLSSGGPGLDSALRAALPDPGKTLRPLPVTCPRFFYQR